MASSSSSSRRREHDEDLQIVSRRPPKVSKKLATEVSRALLACGTKTGLAKALTTLQGAGLLNVSDTEVSLRKALTNASTDHADAVTPYGRVVQKRYIGVPGLDYWEYCHPLAWMYYVSTLTITFGQMLSACIQDGTAAHIIIYIDEVCPGNPFRPDKSRTLQCIYWCMSEWPQWLISRSAAWPCLALLRSKFVEWLPGGISGLMRVILEIMFLGPNSLSEIGVVIQVADNMSLVIRGVFDGILADLKALKESFGWKGTSGFFMVVVLGQFWNFI